MKFQQNHLDFTSETKNSTSIILPSTRKKVSVFKTVACDSTLWSGRSEIPHSPHIELAREFSSWIEADDEYQLFQPTSLNLICFEHCEGNEKSRQILEKLNASGKLFLTHTILNDTYVIRFALGAIRTEMRHIETAWQEIKKAARS